MKRLVLVLGDQLFEGLPGMPVDAPVFMREDKGLATRTRHHKQKLVLFFTAMRKFARGLHHPVEYQKLDSTDARSFVEALPSADELWAYDPADAFFRKELESTGRLIHWVRNPSFLTPPGLWKGRMHMADFYSWQRKRLGILLDGQGRPEGGKWSFDAENREKIPKGLPIPTWPRPEPDPETREVMDLVEAEFPDHPGSLASFSWPTTREEALVELDEFIQDRLEKFGPYEDAISAKEDRLWHSALSPLLNLGLLTPGECVEAAVRACREGKAPLNSVEGFVRQIIGWREFIKLSASLYGREAPNHLDHHRRLGEAWWKGETGLPPLDDMIRGALQRGWHHHIERLMVAGSVMLMSEVHPQEALDWFQSMFVDSADWVMAPNVWGMSQFADGGKITTKPYLSGSAYILRMSDYKKGPWCEVWDGLYWRFIHRHRSLFEKNPRTSVIPLTLDKMAASRRESLFRAAEEFIERTTLDPA